MLIECYSRSIFLQVVIGLVIGVIYGVDVPDLAVQMRPLGDGFIKLIKILITLIVFCVVVNGTSGIGDLKKVGRIGLKSVIYFEILTTIALVLGLVVACNLSLDNDASIHLNEPPADDVALYTGHTQEIRGPVASLMGLTPTSVLSVFARNDTLQVLLFPTLFGSTLNLVGEQTSGAARLISGFSHIVFRITGMIAHLTPLGMPGAVAFTTVRRGIDPLSHLGALVLVLYVIYLVFVMAVLGNVLRLSGMYMLPFLRYFREELMIMMSTAPSDAVLPQVMRKLKHMGIRSPTVGLIIPIDYSFNLNGFSIHLVLAAVFIAHVINTPLAVTDLVTVLLVSLATSKGAHGIPGSTLVILAITFTAVPATPVTGLMLVLPMN